MLGMMDGAFAPSVIHPDKITFMTSIKHLQSVRADSNCLAVVEKIKDLLSSRNTRLQGLQLLELALQQNPDIYLKGRWTAVLFDILKEDVSYILKQHVCKILRMLIPYMAKDPVANAAELQKFASFLFPFLLSQVENKVEWIESAGVCLSTCLKCFPQALESQRHRLLKVLCQQISYCVSSKTFEVFAECFCFIPNCTREPHSYADDWTKLYLMTLNSMHYMLNTFLTFFTEDPFTNTTVPGAEIFPFDDEDNDKVYPAYMKGVRRFINLSKCLAKMLSTKSKHHVQVPIKLTLECISRLFQVQDMSKTAASSSLEMQIVLSTLSQMQIASLVILESLILNFPNILPYSFLISQLMIFALQASSLPNISCETICPLRHAVWRLMDQWVNAHGAKVSSDIVCQQSLIIEELLKDISIEDSSETSVVAAPSKSKKSMCLNMGQKTFVNRSQQVVCREALKALESILYSGAAFITKKLHQEIFAKLIQIAYAVAPSASAPFPYDDDLCRKQLYSALLAIAVVTKTDEREPIQCANGIFKKALLDPSTRVARLCHRAVATCRLYLHPKKPIPIIKDSDDKQRRAPSSVVRFTEWSSEDYVQNLPPIETVSNENITPRITQTFHNPNEDEMPSDEYMQVDAHYSEQAAENQCNGEDVLEIQNSSQCQDDESEDEEEEEDDEPSYGEEDNQEVEMQAEHIYIPSTSKMQVLNPVHITPETEQNVGEQEYEELRPCKSDDSNRNMHLNGVRSSIVPEEERASASAQNIANENGIYGDEDEDLEEEEGDEDEEEESASYSAEKKVPEYFENPAKKQKIDNEAKEEPQTEREGSRSPTLVEMKADFCCNEVDSVKS